MPAAAAAGKGKKQRYPARAIVTPFADSKWQPVIPKRKRSNSKAKSSSFSEPPPTKHMQPPSQRLPRGTPPIVDPRALLPPGDAGTSKEPPTAVTTMRLMLPPTNPSALSTQCPAPPHTL